MDSRYPFTYLVLACRMSPELEQELKGWYMGDILEGFWEMEGRAEDLESLWCYRWERLMARIAPVQVTRYVDARPWLLRALGTPTLRYDKEGEFAGSTCYFAHPVTPPPAPASRKEGADLERFHGVVTATAELARLRGDGLLFIGCWGFLYDHEVPSDQQALMIQAGFQFVDRHG